MGEKKISDKDAMNTTMKTDFSGDKKVNSPFRLTEGIGSGLI